MTKINALIISSLLLLPGVSDAVEDVCDEKVTNKLFSLKEREVDEQGALLALEKIRLWFSSSSDYRESSGNLIEYTFSKMIVEAYHAKLQRIDAKHAGKELSEGWVHEYCKLFGRKARSS